MVEDDKGSRGPWAPVEEFQMDYDTIFYILSRLIFSLDGMASYANRICPRYISLGYEWESVGTNFFANVLGREEFLWLHPHPNQLGWLLWHLELHRVRGCLVFHMLPKKPVYSFVRWGQEWARWVKLALEVHPTFICAPGMNNDFFNGLPIKKNIILEFDFHIQDLFKFDFQLCIVNLVCICTRKILLKNISFIISPYF